jgi:hypothetical protein
MTKQQLFEKLKQNHKLLPKIIDGISSSKPTIRYGCAKVLMEYSEEKPEKLYRHMDFFVDLLESKYRILRWSTIAIIANLTKVDIKNKFDSIFDKYYSFIDDEYMVTVANVVSNSGKIALAKPYLTQKIIDKLLEIEDISLTPHLSEECKKVITQHAIKTFDMFFPQIQQKNRVVVFVKKQCNSSRESLRKEAEKFLERWT